MSSWKRAVVLALVPAAALGLLAATPPGEAPPPVQICPDDEPGTKLEFSGTVLDYAGRPLSKAAVVAYNTGADGLYNPPRGDTRVPRIRGVSVTDDAGRFAFRTVRPGSYPGSTEPAHIHIVVAAPAHEVKHSEPWFADDPHVRNRRIGNDTSVLNPTPRADGTLVAKGLELRLESN